MELTIIEPDALNSDAYEQFTPNIIAERNEQKLNKVILISAVAIGAIILLVILHKYSEN